MPVWAENDVFPNDASELQRQERQKDQLRQQNEQFEDVMLDDGSTETLVLIPEETPCFIIDTFQFKGDEFDQQGLMRALQGPEQQDPPAGKCLGSKGIQVLQHRLQNWLIGKGYLTSQVTVESQDLTKKQLVFTLVAGYIDQIKNKDAEQSKPSNNSIAFKSEDKLNLRDLEQTFVHDL